VPSGAQIKSLTASLGPDKAPIVVLVFSDFESFTCSRSADILAGLLEQSRDIRLIFKHAPATTNRNAFLAHEAALAAGAQGKFWEMHDILFENQTKLTRVDLTSYAAELDLNMPAFEHALDNHIYRPVIESDMAEARGLGIITTPTFFVNGRRLVGPQGYSSLSAVIETALAGIPKSQRLQQGIVASGPAQAIDLKHAPAAGLILVDTLRGSELLACPEQILGTDPNLNERLHWITTWRPAYSVRMSGFSRNWMGKPHLASSPPTTSLKVAFRPLFVWSVSSPWSTGPLSARSRTERMPVGEALSNGKRASPNSMDSDIEHNRTRWPSSESPSRNWS
jgi:predicted DsbA family dithiol-disulfide isomerase